MKKLILAAIFAATITAGAFANDVNKINVRIINRFTTEFTQAQKVNWVLKTNFAKAVFEVDGKKMEAFYDLSGKKIASSQSVTLNELPADAKKTLNKQYEGYNVTEAIRVEGAEETAYFLTVDNGKEKIILKSTEDGNLSYFQKLK